MLKTRVYVNKSGKFWLRLFIILAFLGFVGVALLIGGKLVYVVSMEPVILSAPVSIKIDLASSYPIYSLNTIPGWLISPESLEDKKIASFQFADIEIYYKIEHWERLIQELAAASRTNNQVIVGVPTSTKESEWRELDSGKSFQATYTVGQTVINQPPIAEWVNAVSKLEVDEAVLWLKSQPQVNKVKIGFFSQLLANFSKKMLQTEPRVVIVLDK